ncbi:hypothetical protein BLL52_1853 [Rhodoferax antarcticus ANT.BR]|uniref:Uncharacterized protein n=1 Tax=Rhodoferax antarcticus ANT.BR TaxID=1111071 RepID=A0A1Q8YGH8_9BURK|nr:hypothetical protein BLL52_1853 [Rhodoferax antarcticus ANT.BR]
MANTLLTSRAMRRWTLPPAPGPFSKAQKNLFFPVWFNS